MKVLVSAIALSALFAAPAQAWEVKTTSEGAMVHWERHLLPITIVRTGIPQKDVLLERAVRSAAKEWADAANIVVDLQFADAGDIGFDAHQTNTSVIKWSGGTWAHDPGTLALTFLRYDMGSGKIFDADILINDEQYEWADKAATSDANARYDLQNTLTHELGHALGLAHSAMDHATMYASTASA